VELSLHLGVVWLRNGNVNENEIFPRWNGKEIVDCVFFLGLVMVSGRGAVAKLEQTGGGAQLYHKHSDTYDVQTNSITNLQFLT
jgi:hypothetical protein